MRGSTGRGQASGLCGIVGQFRVNEFRSPLPPLEDYEAWFGGRSSQGKSRQRVLSAHIARRVATLRRAGDTWAEIARCCSLKHSGSAKAIFFRLPEELR